MERTSLDLLNQIQEDIDRRKDGITTSKQNLKKLSPEERIKIVEAIKIIREYTTIDYRDTTTLFDLTFDLL